MAEGLEQEHPDNTCCAALKKKHTKLVERYSKLEETKNKFRNCIALVQQKYDVIERENKSLKQALIELKVETERWKDEMEKETGIRVDLEDEVSALKDEIQLLKQHGNTESQEADKKLQERLDEVEKEFNKLKELLDKERGKVASEKKNAASERKKANEAMKKLELEKRKANEAEKVANIERKKAEESRLLLEKLKTETDAVKSMLASEKSKSEAAEKKLETEKEKASRERKRADSAVAKAEEQWELAETNLKKAMSEKDRADDLNCKLEEARDRAEKLEAELRGHLHAGKCLEAEKQKATKERERADSAVAKAEEHRGLAETNLKKFMFEKDRADDLQRKFKEVKDRAQKLEGKLHEQLHAGKIVQAHADISSTGKNAESCNDVYIGMLKNDIPMSGGMDKMRTEKEQNIAREKNRADTETKNAKKQKKLAEAHKKMAMEEKCRADQLSIELEIYKVKLEKLQKQQELVSLSKPANNLPLRCNNFISQNDTVKLLNKELKLEKMLVKHAKSATKVEVIRNNMLQQELLHLKQEFLQFQQRLDLLDDSVFYGGEGIHKLEQICDQTLPRGKSCSDSYGRQLISGTNSRLDPPFRGSNPNMLQSSAISSSSASFSDRPLVGSQERGPFSITTSAKLGGDTSNIKSTISRLSDDNRITRYNDHFVAKTDKSFRSTTKSNADERRVRYRGKNRILDAVESIENLYSKGEKLHQRVSEKLSLLHFLLDDQNSEPAQENLLEDSCRKHVRPFKRRKTSEETMITNPFCDSGEQNSMLGVDADLSNAIVCVSPPECDVTKSDKCFQDGQDNALGSNRCFAQDSCEMSHYDYVKLLDLDNSDDEKSYLEAIAMPLSPTLPEVQFHVDGRLEVHSPEIQVERSSEVGLPTSTDIDMEQNSTNFVSNSIASSELQTKEDPTQVKKITGSIPSSDAHFHVIHMSGEKLGIPDISCSGEKEISMLRKSRTAGTPAGPLKYLVVFPDNIDNDSILRILRSVDSCMPRCFLLHSEENFLQSLLSALLKTDDLSKKEKACVFYSTMLHGIYEVRIKNLTNGLNDDLVEFLDSLTLHIQSALCDPALRRIFVESCDWFELLALNEDFFLQRKVLVCGDVTDGAEVINSSKFDLLLNGNAMVLSEVVASVPLLVAAGSLLASLVLAVDHVGFVCEMSCNMFMMQKSDPAVVLAILHVFAHICCSKYFSLPQYALAMKVVKSLVTFLEKQFLANSSCFSDSVVKSPSKIWLCNSSCPFSKDAVSVEDAALLLLEKLKKYSGSVSWSPGLLQLVKSQVHTISSDEDRTRGGSGTMEGASGSATSAENLSDFIDILSLIEILASSLGWDWTFDNIVNRICEWLGSCLTESSAASIIVLLGQLGRFGVGACGYDDTRVKKLRGILAAHVCEGTFKKLHISAQIALVNALFSVTPGRFEEVIEEDKIEAAPAIKSADESMLAIFIRQWFSQLSCEQQSIFRRYCGFGFSP